MDFSDLEKGIELITVPLNNLLNKRNKLRWQAAGMHLIGGIRKSQ